MRALLLLVVAACAALSCTAGHPPVPEWLPATPETRADYDVFAERCSKCHSLARPLNSGIDDDEYWKLYVAKMRRQPGSGISLTDAQATLRFLHFYALEQRRKKGLSAEVHDPPPPPPDAADASVDASPPPRAP